MARSRLATQKSARTDLHARLRDRQVEIEDVVLTRVLAVSDPSEVTDHEYAEALRAAVRAAVSYGLAAVDLGEERCPPPPPALLAQARLAAHNGVSLDTVMRRYFAGYTLIGDFLVEEAERDGLLRGPELQRLLRAQAALFDRLLVVISEEYGREAGMRPSSTEERHAERIERLLAGEPLDTSALEYDFEAHHLGVLGRGEGSSEAVRELARRLDRRLLAMRRDESTVWAWLGGRKPIDCDELRHVTKATWPAGVSLAVGEPAQGLGGWRVTHRQAKAALPIALRSEETFIHYADVALLASILQDDLLATSLRQIYLAPLEAERDGGAALRETLRAYFAAERNVSSAAAALGVRRHTVTSRLRSIEKRLGRPLDACASEVEAALRVDDLDATIAPRNSLGT